MGEKICAVDCGTEREVTIDCPSTCTYLIASHRWEESHPKSVAETAIPFPDVSFSADVIRSRSTTLSELAYAVLVYAREHPGMTDVEVFEAAHAMAETYRTLASGIYYEKPPQGPVAAGLYAAIAKFIEDDKNAQGQRPDIQPLKTTEMFQLLVFLSALGAFVPMAAREHAPSLIFCGRNIPPRWASRKKSLALSYRRRFDPG
jgi:hypothetical protein